MSHVQNIAEFKKAFSCGSDLVESYCRLIAIELKLSNIQPTKTHDIISKLQNLSKDIAGTPHAGALNTRISDLKRAFKSIHVESKKGARTLPSYSYPHMRYVRFIGDWQSQATSPIKVSDLNRVVKSTILTLKAVGTAI